MMRDPGKADLLPGLESLAPRRAAVPQTDVSIIDGAALVHKLDPKKSNAVPAIKTFNDYAHIVFVPYLLRELNNVVQLHVIWDTYKADSLKEQTRLKRGTGMSVRISARTSIPNNWNTFLRVDSNKKALFQFLGSAIESVKVPEVTSYNSRRLCALSSSNGCVITAAMDPGRSRLLNAAPCTVCLQTQT